MRSIIVGAILGLAGPAFAAPASPADKVAEAAHFLSLTQNAKCSMESPLCVYAKTTMVDTIGGLLFSLPGCTPDACSGRAGDVAAAAKVELASLGDAADTLIPRVRDPSFQVRADAALRELSQTCTLGATLCTQGRLGVLAEIDESIRRAPCPSSPPDPSCDLAKNAQMEWIDSISSDWLAYILDHQGWPSASQYGEGAEDQAWLLAQHADRRPALQRRALGLVRAAAEREGRPSQKRHLAYLEDRLAAHEGRPQTYGTQTTCDRVQGLISFPSIANPAQIDQRRASMGMGPLAEYLREVAAGANCPLAVKLP